MNAADLKPGDLFSYANDRQSILLSRTNNVLLLAGLSGSWSITIAACYSLATTQHIDKFSGTPEQARILRAAFHEYREHTLKELSEYKPPFESIPAGVAVRVIGGAPEYADLVGKDFVTGSKSERFERTNLHVVVIRPCGQSNMFNALMWGLELEVLP